MPDDFLDELQSLLAHWGMDRYILVGQVEGVTAISSFPPLSPADLAFVLSKHVEALQGDQTVH